MIEENSYLSQKKIARTLSLHRDIAKRLITEELNLRRVNFKWVPHPLTASQKRERVKISPKLFGKFNQPQSTISLVSSRHSICFSILRDCISIAAAAS
jgi:hypothetical protein